MQNLIRWTLQVLIGANVRVEPYAVVQAGAALEAGAALSALRKAKSGCVRERKDPLALLRAIGRGQKPSEDALAALKKCGPAWMHVAAFSPLLSQAVAADEADSALFRAHIQCLRGVAEYLAASI